MSLDIVRLMTMLSAGADIDGADGLHAAGGRCNDPTDSAEPATPRHPDCSDDAHAITVSVLRTNTAH